MNLRGGRNRRHIVDVLFTLALFCVFAAASLIVVFIGADVYRTAVGRVDRGFEVNTTLMFVATNIRQRDTYDAVRVDQIEGLPSLVLQQNIGENTFETWIFHHNGALREIFVNVENRAVLSLAAGQHLVDVYSFDIELVDERLVAITAGSADGTTARMVVGLRSGSSNGGV
ncbi:MAG: DUF4860 domain-containing protein [Defluviitaleaceae bacterium]|nr:DUF4860 domain-containing protein [Defluviitaleaceae bacterium]